MQFHDVCDKSKTFTVLTAIDECASRPCQNDGVCVDQVGSYTCACPPGWTGNQCEISKSYLFIYWSVTSHTGLFRAHHIAYHII